jgi:hypothetical protein
MDNREKNRVVKICVPVLLVVALLLTGRIWWLNTNAEQTQQIIWECGEFVDLKDNYFVDEYEIADGYRVRVNSYSVETYLEFLQRYAGEEAESLLVTSDYQAGDMVLTLNATFQNTNSFAQDIGIDLYNYCLYGTDYSLLLDDFLYSMSNAEKKSTSTMFSLQPDSELDFQLPYVIDITSKYSYLTMQDMQKEPLYLTVSLYPVENRITIWCVQQEAEQKTNVHSAPFFFIIMESIMNCLVSV